MSQKNMTVVGTGAFLGVENCASETVCTLLFKFSVVRKPARAFYSVLIELAHPLPPVC